MAQAARDGWTDERIATAARLHGAGWNASQIAKHLSCGLSRSAVIGKLYRLGLVRSDIARKVRFATGAAQGRAIHRVKTGAEPPTPKEVTLPPERPHDGPVVDILDLASRMCKWPVGQPGAPGFGFCGRKCEGVYCADHHKIAYTPVPPRGRKPATPPDLQRLARQFASG